MGVSLLQKYSKPFSMSYIYPKSPVFPCYEAFIAESGKRVNLIIFYLSDESNLLFYAPKKKEEIRNWLKVKQLINCTSILIVVRVLVHK